MNTAPLIFILYDSVTNSVFEGQVKKLLQKKAAENPYRPVHLVTFESRTLTIQKNFKDIRITYLKRMPFIGWPTLLYATKQLTSFLRLFPEYAIIARGPIAGVIAQRSVRNTACTQLIIQARGLLAQEYEYMHARVKRSPIVRFVHRFRAAQLSNVETQAYKKHASINKTIEAVSPALRERLISAYSAHAEIITIARDDIPQTIKTTQKKAWRTIIRNKLLISEDWTVYCYNGSAKPWQKPGDTIAFFKDTLKKKPYSFLLILTTDVSVFEILIGDSIAPNHYTIISVNHDEVYQYLCASDYGLLFRDDHVINWISRPTKALEYHAAGLEIIHNNTVAFLIDNAM